MGIDEAGAGDLPASVPVFPLPPALPMVVVGAYAHLELSQESSVPPRLEALDGVSTFDLGVAGKIGILIEARSLDEAHARLTQEVREVEGVRGVFPVYVNAEEAEEEPGENLEDGVRSHAQRSNP